MSALILGLLAWSSLAAAAPSLDGLYSSVCLYPETDDYGGMEVQVKTGKGPPVVRFAVCEGGCSPEPVSTVQLGRGRISFSTREDLVDQDGKLAESHVYSYRGVFRHGRLDLNSDRPGWPKEIRLPRRAKADATTAKPAGGQANLPTPWRRCR